MARKVTKASKTTKESVEVPSEFKFLNVNQTRKEMFLNNMLGGLAWGIGATIGLALFITILGLIAHYINVVPFVGGFVSNIIDYVLQHNPRLH